MQVRLWALAGVATAALAGQAEAGVSKTTNFSAVGGQKVLIGYYGVVYDTGHGCEAMPVSEPTITQKPDRGTLHYEKSTRTIPTHGACADATVRTETYALWYTPDLSFKGTDVVKIRIPAQRHDSTKNILTDGARHLVTREGIEGVGVINVTAPTEENDHDYHTTNSSVVAQAVTLNYSTQLLTSMVSGRIAGFAAGGLSRTAVSGGGESSSLTTEADAPEIAPESGFGAAGGSGSASGMYGRSRTQGLAGMNPLQGSSFGSDNVTLALFDGSFGLSAGDEEPRLGVWANGALNWVSDESALTRYRGDIVNGVVGVDYRFTDMIMAGVAMSYEATSISTEFNAGNADSSGWVLAPYGALVFLNGQAVVDAMVGFGQMSTDTERNAGVTGSYDSDRFLAAFNATYYEPMTPAWLLHGKIGYLYGSDEGDTFTESDGTVVNDPTARIGTLRFEAGGAYTYESVEPYLNAAFLYDTNHSVSTPAGLPATAHDSTAVEVVAGMNWYLAANAAGTFEVAKEFFRDDIDNTTLSLALRLTF